MTLSFSRKTPGLRWIDSEAEFLGGLRGGEANSCRFLRPPAQFLSVVAVFALAVLSTAGGPPAERELDLGPRVLVFDPSMTNLQARLDVVFQEQESSQFGTNRYALLFRPGKYRADVQVGFYTQVLGLGASPDEVVIEGAVRSKANWMAHHNATCNFWRGVENLAVRPTLEGPTNVWAVSQSTSLRRVHIQGDLRLWDGGWSSGGFLADCRIDGRVDSGSQQQWFSRNSAWGGWNGANWNMVFVGIENPPPGRWPDPPYTVIDETPVIREKPRLQLTVEGRYAVRIPPLQRGGTRGPGWSPGRSGEPGSPSDDALVPLEAFHVADPDRDTAASLNRALAAGQHLLFTPGIYRLEAALHVARAGTVVLGLGFPTLQVTHGTPALMVDDVDGVKVGGLLVEAGPMNSPVLVDVGVPGSRRSHEADPTFLWDLFCRAGGAQAGRATSLLTIHSDDVVADNLWLWRADHGEGVGWATNPVRHGLVVHGDRVTMYGLFVEHTLDYQTVWNGEGGRVYFYQSEMPYDPPSQEAWKHGEVDGFASYKVADHVRTHEAWGLGVYCVFVAAPVIAENAFETPTAPGVRLHHLVTIRLTGKPGSGMRHILNGRGDAVITTRKAVLD